MPAAAIVLVVIAAVQIGMSIKQMQDEKDAAKKQEKLRKEQLEIQTKDRELREEREKASLAREARAKRSALLNTAAFMGVQNSSQATGGSAAVEAARVRETTFIDQVSDLSDQADETTRKQIELDASAAARNATMKGISGVLKGIGTAASAFGGSGGAAAGAASSQYGDGAEAYGGR